MKINGKRVEDAKKPMRISITRDDAFRGTNKDPENCAAALAIVRGYQPSGVKAAKVHLGRVYVEYPTKWVRYKTPDSLRAEIVSFDRGSSAQYMEGEYSLQAIPPGDRLGERSRRAESPPSPKSGRRKIVMHPMKGVRPRKGSR